MPTPNQQTAIDWSRNFVGDGAGRVFFNIGSVAFLNDLEARIANPRIINQQQASVCGPATFLYGMAQKGPLRYAMFACNLFMHGSARLGKLNIVAPENVRGTAPLHDISPADWVTLASLRLARNWFFTDPANLDQTFWTGVTWPAALARWFSKAGYSSANRANLLVTKGWINWSRAYTRFTNGEIVCLFINANMLYPRLRGTRSSTPNHWVGLANVRSQRNPVDVDIFTWGQARRLYFTAANERSFKRHYYGYVSAGV